MTDLTIPAGVREACAKGLGSARSLTGRLTPGPQVLTRAKSLSGAGVASESDVRALAAWHKRNTKHHAQWDLHGGTAGREWASKVLASLDPSSVHVDKPVGEEPEVSTYRAVEYEAAPAVDTAWDATEAEKHLRTWAGVESPEDLQDKAKRDKYAKGFAIVRGDGTKYGDFSLPHHDVVDGKLVTNKHGVSAAIAALNGGRGGMKGVSESERKAALAHLEKHAAEWHDKDKDAAKARAEAVKVRAFELTSTKLMAAEVPPPSDEPDADGYLSKSWIQVAQFGTYKGHPAGPFEFTSGVFDEMVANHEANPNGIVPFDYEHSSESINTSVMQHGAPANGWITQLDNREAEGLYALVGWVDRECIGYLRSGRYKFCSPAVVFDATDPVSGEGMGPVLVSAAVTNRPFLQGMRPLTARAQQLAMAARADGSEPTTMGMYGDSLDTREGMIECLRNVFGLRELAPESEVIAALDELERLAAKPEDERGGIDIDNLVSSLRWAMRLPQLTSASDVIAEVRKGLDASKTEDKPAADATATTARNGEGTKTETKMAEEKSPAHAALEQEHQRLIGEHTKLKDAHAELSKKHESFKMAVCKAMAMEPESEESTITDALHKKMEHLDLADKAEAERMKAEEEHDVKQVAARMSITDESALAGLRLLRKANANAFKGTFGAILQSATATAAVTPVVAPTRPAEAQPNTAAWEALMAGRVAPGGGAAPFLASAPAGLDAEAKQIDELMLEIHRKNPGISGVAAMKQAVDTIRGRQ